MVVEGVTVGQKVKKVQNETYVTHTMINKVSDLCADPNRGTTDNACVRPLSLITAD